MVVGVFLPKKHRKVIIFFLLIFFTKRSSTFFRGSILWKGWNSSFLCFSSGFLTCEPLGFFASFSGRTSKSSSFLSISISSSVSIFFELMKKWEVYKKIMDFIRTRSKFGRVETFRNLRLLNNISSFFWKMIYFSEVKRPTLENIPKPEGSWLSVTKAILFLF